MIILHTNFAVFLKVVKWSEYNLNRVFENFSFHIDLFWNWHLQIIDKFVLNVWIDVGKSQCISLIFTSSLYNCLFWFDRLFLFLCFFLCFLLRFLLNFLFGFCFDLTSKGILFLLNSIFIESVFIKIYVQRLSNFNKPHLLLTFVKGGKIRPNKIVYSLKLFDSR